MDAAEMMAHDGPQTGSMSCRPGQGRRGVTLLELLLGAMLGVIVVLAMGQVDMTRIYLTDQISRASNAQSEAAVAFMSMLRSFQQADRVIVDTTASSVLLRLPQAGPGVDLDADASYHWVQYRHSQATGLILYYDPMTACRIASHFGNCSGGATGEACFTALDVVYSNEAIAPPGGDPNPEDNNVLGLDMRWTDSKTGLTQQYIGQVTIRASAYTDLGASDSGTVKDSGTGLAPQRLSLDPPPLCTNDR